MKRCKSYDVCIYSEIHGQNWGVTGTGMMLETHYGYFEMAKNPESNYFQTSSLILRDMSGLVLLSFYFIGGHSGLRGSLCMMMLVSNPRIS